MDMTDSIRPCPFCGQTEFTGKEGEHIWCSYCTMKWVSLYSWNSAYCWTRIDELEKCIESWKKEELHWKEIEKKLAAARDIMRQIANLRRIQKHGFLAAMIPNSILTQLDEALREMGDKT